MWFNAALKCTLFLRGMKTFGERETNLVQCMVENLIVISIGTPLFWLGLCVLSAFSFALHLCLSLGFLMGVLMVNLIMI